MNKLLIVILILAALLFPLTAAAFSIFSGTVPSAAKSIASDLDAQLMKRYADCDRDSSISNRKAVARSRIMIMGTTPTNVTDLDTVCPLARQMTEEISSRLVDKGYRYQELRKGSMIRFDRGSGEFILTRDVKQLAQRNGSGQAILAGTYVISGKHVRFNFSLIHTLSNEVLAKASASVPITEDLYPLLEERSSSKRDGGYSSGRVPSTYTRLQ
ncbi:MAG: hypothetical protein K6F46_10610 [Desulfovibrio sp.]|nr:hypothetical protein [Desulfovibrio sp.]